MPGLLANLAHPWLLALYALVGPGAWLLFLAATVMAYTRMNRLIRQREIHLPIEPPSVTVLVPAKDEGEGMRACLERVLALDYPRATVLAIDDRSTDQTGAIMDEFAAAHPDRLRILHIPPGGLPPGWLGKCNALHTAAAGVTSDWLLFVDSDVKIAPQSLSAVLSVAAGREYDAVSIMTRLETHTFWEKLILPLAAASVGVMTLMSLTNDDNRKHTAFANGQFFLIRRNVYEGVGGHAAVRDNITEDVALMRLIKARGYTTRLYYGQHLASTRMHTNLRQMFNGWARIYSGVCERRPAPILAAMLFVVLCGLSVYAALILGAARAVHGDSLWLSLAVSHLALMTIALVTIYRMSGNLVGYALAFPVAGPVLLAIYGYAVRACRTGRIAWRGTTYTSGSVSGGASVTPPAASSSQAPSAASTATATRAVPGESPGAARVSP